MIKIALIVLISGGLLGCNSTPTEQVNCQSQDWYNKGKENVEEGRSVRHFNQHIKQCGSSLPTTAKEQYIQGYRDGLVEHCNFDKGYERGEMNLSSISICPLELREQYNKGYQRGKQARLQTIRDLERANDSANRAYSEDTAISTPTE
ncbi:DUF2799 domain-containing protein [Alteromonadaceae bacterium BrNp21-10]|nr:DUF2799 domain-containing protein [Alteromonadaceae bacterium BrNp21-10]